MSVDVFMYDSKMIAKRIRTVIKQQGKTSSQILAVCKLGKNTISKIENGTDILTLNFAKIADSLNCSVDYLLGRTDNPNVNKDSNNTKNENVENLIFRYNNLTNENKIKLEGCLLAIEKEQIKK